MKRPAALSGAIAGALMLLFAPDCTVESGAGAPLALGAGGADDAGAAAEGVTIGAAVWTLTWDRSRVEDADRDGGWSVETDLGYRVHLASGWIVDHSVSLGPCVIPKADGGTVLLGLRFGIRSAHAHDDADPSAREMIHVEDLTHPTDAGPFPSVFPATRYCRAHWLVARATSPSDAPSGLDFTQTSVRLAGTWARDGEEHAFTVDTWWPQGHLEDLDAITDPASLAEAQADGETRWAWITVRRRLGVLFDGIDFAVDPDEVVAGTVIDNLVRTAEMRATLRRPTTG